MIWKETIDAAGVKVHVVERSPGRISLRWWSRTRQNWCWRALKHGDREEALTQATQLAADLRECDPADSANLTVGELLTKYEYEVSRHKRGKQPKEDLRRKRIWLRVFGTSREVRTIDYPTLNRFVRDRRAGKVGLGLRSKVSETTIGADIVYLQSALNWAKTRRLANGLVLLDSNPVQGYKRPKTARPKRPVATYDRYLSIMEKADPQFRAFFRLLVSLGWRVTAVCRIRASDVDLTHDRIRKAGEVDKEGVEMWVPLSNDGRKAIQQAMQVNPVTGTAYLFPSPRRKGKPWRREYARDLLERAELLAELEPLEGGDFHPYRRMWATERKHLPDVDVAATGGWKDLRSLQTCYQDVDEATMRRVVSEPRRLRDAK